MSAPSRYQITIGLDPRYPEGVTISAWMQLNVDGAKAAGRPKGWRPILVYRSTAAAADGLREIAAQRRLEAAEMRQSADAMAGLRLHLKGLVGEQVTIHEADTAPLELGPGNTSTDPC